MSYTIGSARLHLTASSAQAGAYSRGQAAWVRTQDIFLRLFTLTGLGIIVSVQLVFVQRGMLK